MTKKRITIIDVAKAAGVSKQTVSRVINDRSDVATETRQRVKQHIQELGYRPDPIARSMKGHSRTLGCITPNLSDYNFSSIVQGAQIEARKQGYFILTGSAQAAKDVPPLLNEMLLRRVDGLIVINPKDDDREQHFLQLIKNNIPIVYLKNTPGEEAVSAVCLDDKTGGFIATHYLTNLGHTRIATVLGPHNEECTQDRLVGFQKAHLEVGIEADSNLVVQGNWSAASGNIAITQLLGTQIPFTAVFAHNDLMAIGAIKALRDSGLKVPEDISVIGYDDIPLTSYLDPPLTTIRQPMDQFGEIGTQLLIEAIISPKIGPRVVKLDPTLLIRESCTSI